MYTIEKKMYIQREMQRKLFSFWRPFLEKRSQNEKAQQLNFVSCPHNSCVPNLVLLSAL